MPIISKETEPAVVVVETPDTPPPDPVAGGNYLRDPITGALSVNPAFDTPKE